MPANAGVVDEDLERTPIDERDTARVAARALYEDGIANGDYVLTKKNSADRPLHR
jgi:hypothetical protein